MKFIQSLGRAKIIQVLKIVITNVCDSHKHISLKPNMPTLARVILDRRPNVYDTEALRLKVLFSKIIDQRLFGRNTLAVKINILQCYWISSLYLLQQLHFPC